MEQRRQNAIIDQLLLLEHTPVITLGRAVSEQHLLVPTEHLEQEKVDYRRSGRGGDITYHGPGQLVVYPIVALQEGERDMHRYLRNLEEAMIEVCLSYGIEASRLEGKTGVWVGQDKLASIGIRVSRWVTSHGIAINYAREALGGFRWITPCGLTGVRMVSLEHILGKKIDRLELEGRLIEVVCRILERHPKEEL